MGRAVTVLKEGFATEITGADAATMEARGLRMDLPGVSNVNEQAELLPVDDRGLCFTA